MIVSCPTCQTRYRHMTAAAAGSTGHCGRCEADFPLQEARRPYVLIRTPSPRMRIGMDDPSLAPQIAGSALETGEGLAAATSGDVAPTPTSSGAFGGMVVATVPTVLGAGLAYYFSGSNGADPVLWAPMGGAIGLLFGWGALLWMRRKD